MVKKRFKITDMHCTSCAILIDGDLEDLDGVVSAKTNYTKGETEIEFDPDKMTVESLMEVIKKTGYRAEPIDF